uniref:Autophagy protein ATG16 n=1 Tax=Bursaphelenchus xylophilus TaxID=6326 RepID=A0A4D6J3T5_BURXY|nr:autophagy protein ATG16 [Bursaphelenchus xylophilus]
MTYRDDILKSLKERDRFTSQFSRIVESYVSISDSLNYVLSRQSMGGGGSVDVSKDSQELRNELAEVYKKKAANDELLIEAQKKVRELEKRLTEVVESKGGLEHEVKELKIELEKKELELQELKTTNELLNDELLALNMETQSLNKKFVDADQERVVLINKIKELKEKEIEYMNEFNDKEHQIRLQRLRSEIDDATKPSSQNSSRRSSRKYSETFSTTSTFDSIPSRCEYKFECDGNGEVNDCVWNRSGRIFYTGGSDKLIRVWEPQANAPPILKAKIAGSTKAINRLDLHPDSPLLLSACSDNTVYLFNTDDKRRRFAFTGHSDKVMAARFIAQANRIVSGSSDRTLRIWDINSGACVRTLMPASMCSDVATCNRGIASSHYDKWIRLWDGKSETPYHQIKMGGKITSLHLSTDGQLLLACCRDETLSLIDLRENEIVHIYAADQFRTSYEYCKCAISPGGGYVSAGSWDGQLYIFNLQSTKLEKVLTGHDNSPVYSLAWNPNDGSIISTDKKRTACLWM